MKKTIFILSIILLIAIDSSGQPIRHSQYDKTINSLVVKLKKRPGKSSAVEQLDSLYQLANNQDKKHIRKLKLSGQPDIWHEVYDTYQKLAARQESVDVLDIKIKEQIGFKPEDYQAFLSESLIKACDYYYALAQKNLKSNSVEGSSKALQYLQEIDTLKPDFKDVQKLLIRYQKKGPIVIYYRVEDKYPNELPSSMSNAIQNIDLSAFDNDSLIFLYKKPKNKEFEYYVELKITEIFISPEKTDELYYTESADIQDGVAYKVDENGDFLHDSEGNKIEIPKYKTIACYVTESIQHKSMLVLGSVEIVERASGDKIAKKQVSGETKFFHRSAQFKGDLNALLPETFELIGSRKLQYPTDLMMIINATDKLGKNAVDIIAEEIGKQKAGEKM
jgi:hypothetical protein